MKIKTNNLLFAAAIVTLLNFSSCSKYEDGPNFSLRTKTNRLVGEWEVVRITDSNGTVYGSGYNIDFTFEKDGDFTMTSSYSYNGQTSSYSYSGSWEWKDSKQAFDLSIDASSSVERMTITKLKNKEMVFKTTDNDTWELEAK